VGSHGERHMRRALKRAHPHLRHKIISATRECVFIYEEQGLFPVERRTLAGHPPWGELSRLILLLFGGVPNSPRVAEYRSQKCERAGRSIESNGGRSTPNPPGESDR
jgi:hypothetical protein